MAGEDTNKSSPPPLPPPEAPQMVSPVKLSILKKGEYILWTIKMEQYLAYTDYALWEVILNGNGKVQMQKYEVGNEVEVPPVTAQQTLARTRERKAKSALLMAIPDEHLARFHGIKDAKTLWAAIKIRFGAWSNISLIMRNKPDIDNLDIDDLYNNLIVYEDDIKGSSRSSSNSPNLAFVFTESTSSTNELNAAYSVATSTSHSSQAQEGTLPGIAEQQGIQETWVDQLGMQGEDTNKSSPPPLPPPEAPQMVSPVKLSILKKVQMKKYEVGNEVEVPPVTAQQILARIRERKAKSALLMPIPDEHLARFHGIKDAKTLWAAIKIRFGGNVESKKMQKDLLKQ
nr:ribonuclease H-like domain-containing protein [Tanacetum cinerariifolium]